MADVLLSDLTEETDPGLDALVYVLDNPSTTPADRKVTVANILKSSGGRERLLANRTYYVRTDGSDSNTGLVDTAGGAFLTLQKALTVVSSYINLNGFNVTIQIGDGTYVGDNVVNTPWDGNGTVTITGNAATPDNVILTPASATGSTILVSGARLIVTNLKIYEASTTSIGLHARYSGYIGFSNITFACGIHIKSEDYSKIESLGNYRIANGTYAAHLVATYYSTLSLLTGACTITGTPSFSDCFASSSYRSTIYISTVYTGSATGVRYKITNSYIFTPSHIATSETFFPGNAVGTMDSDSIYGSRDYSTNTKFTLLSDFSVTSSTTLVPAVGTGRALAGHRYIFKAVLFTTSNVSGGVKFAIGGDCTATSIIYEGRLWSGGTCTQTRGAALNAAVGAVTAVTAAYMEIDGSILVNDQGDLWISFAQNASNGAASTILAGSWFEFSESDGS